MLGTEGAWRARTRVPAGAWAAFREHGVFPDLEVAPGGGPRHHAASPPEALRHPLLRRRPHARSPMRSRASSARIRSWSNWSGSTIARGQVPRTAAVITLTILEELEDAHRQRLRARAAGARSIIEQRGTFRGSHPANSLCTARRARRFSLDLTPPAQSGIETATNFGRACPALCVSAEPETP